MSYYKLSWSGRRSVIRFSGFVCPSTAWNLYFHIPLILSCQDLSDVGQCLMFVNRSDLKSIDGFLTSRTGATRCSNINNLRGSYEGRILKNWGFFFFQSVKSISCVSSSLQLITISYVYSCSRSERIRCAVVRVIFGVLLRFSVSSERFLGLLVLPSLRSLLPFLPAILHSGNRKLENQALWYLFFFFIIYI